MASEISGFTIDAFRLFVKPGGAHVVIIFRFVSQKGILNSPDQALPDSYGIETISPRRRNLRYIANFICIIVVKLPILLTPPKASFLSIIPALRIWPLPELKSLHRPGTSRKFTAGFPTSDFPPTSAS